MKNAFTLAAAALCLVLGLAQGRGQTDTNTTNTVSASLQTLNISLTGLSGGGTGTNGGGNSFRVTTKDVLKALGVTTSGAKLQFGTGQLTTTNGTTNVQVFLVSTGSGKNQTFTDVSNLFFIGTNSDMFASGGNTGQINTFGFGVDTNGMVLTNDAGAALSSLTFLVQGFTTLKKNGSFTSLVNGTGTSGVNPTILRGTISASAPNAKTRTVPVTP